MLKEFTIKNFTSFKDEITFSMEADVERVSEHADHIVKINDQNILRTASMYGPNGGGKSNVLLALRLVKLVQQNIGYPFTYEYPCIFTQSDQIDETVFFVDEKYEMGYRFSVIPGEVESNEQLEDINPRRNLSQRRFFDFLYEEVTFRKKGETEYTFLFSRDHTGFVDSELINGEINNANLNLAKGMSVIKYLYRTFANTDKELGEGLNVIKHLTHEINKIFMLDSYNARYVRFGNGIHQLIEKHANTLVDMLCKLDIHIKGINVYEERLQPIYFMREVNDNNGEIVDRELPLNMESDGTQKVFWFLLLIIENMSNGNIFCCDDINAFLHPKLCREIIKLFQNNNYMSQLIFNSHDIINMDNQLFRRDEIWFVYRDDNYSSRLLPLSNIENYKGEQVRKDAKYGKQYLEGKYGADPFIKRGLNWNV